MKKFAAALFLCLMLTFVSAVAEPLTVIATDFPCYDLLRAVAGNDAEVSMLIKPGTEVHSYEPTPAEILSLSEADLFVCIGGESDVWVDGVLASLGSGVPETLRMMEHVPLLGEDGGDGEMDEHIWTSPKNALLMLRAAEDALCAMADDATAERFHENADAYAVELEALDAKLTELTANAARKTIVVADRFPLIYLVHEYGLDYEAAFASCTAQTEPDAKTMMRLTDKVLSEKIPVVYIIEMSNGHVAEVLAAETGAKILPLHSMQTVTLDEFEAGETYISLMKKNIESLSEGLNG